MYKYRLVALVCALGFAPITLALHAPEPDPPYAYGNFPDGSKKEEPHAARSPTTEWSYHKTLDGTHPDDTEQRMLWHINRARQDPAAEGEWLAVVDDEDGQISTNRSGWDVNASVLISEFNTYAAKPPVAFDSRLYEAAKEHSDYLISIDGQNHIDQFTRVQNAGFKYSRVGGNVFSYAQNGLHAHAAFNIDWGFGTDGTQDPPGHRYTIMSVEYDYTNVGLAAVEDNDSSNSVGPLVVTGNHASTVDGYYTDHYNQFLVGTVWEDFNGNSLYDAGEGVGGVQVIPDSGTYFAITSDAGGYAIPLPDGPYLVSFVKSDTDYKQQNVTMNGESVLMDWNLETDVPEEKPPLAAFSVSPQRGFAPLMVTLDHTASTDPDGEITNYAWQVNGQPTPTEPGDTANTKKLTLSGPGTYNIQLTVTDNDGLTDSASQTVTVEASTDQPQTLILTHYTKLVELYGSSRADALMAKLDALALHESVVGKVMKIDDDASALAAINSRGSNYDDKYLANALSTAIQQLIQTEWDANSQLKYLLVVGDDRVIPFHRVADGTWYPDDWTLTDDYYADHPPYNNCPNCANPEIYIPDLPIGRLVETPEQMIHAIDQFLANDTLVLNDAAVVGWDFLIDGAREHCDALKKGGLTADCSLIGSTWNADQLSEKLFTVGADTAVINLHADYNAYQSPVYDIANPTHLLNGTADLTRSLYTSTGCHSGQNVSHASDWPESYLEKGATYIGNTGYGWGGSGVVLSEKLIHLLSEQLAQGAQTVGLALIRAKQRYHAQRRAPTPYDEKVALESTLYGFPMSQLQVAKSRAPESQVVQKITSRTRSPDGRSKTGLSYTWPSSTPVTGDDGSYYTLEGSITSEDQTPILPKLSQDITQSGKLHGVVFKGGNYSVLNTTPAKQHYTTTTGHQTPQATFTAPGWYPSQFFAAHTTELHDGELQTLIATAGQTDPSKSQGQQRIFSNMDFDAHHHSDDTDWTASAVHLSGYSLTKNSATLEVSASDSAGVAEVVVAYTDGKGSWNSVSLTGIGSIWSGEFAASDSAEFFIQAVDGFGNVAVNDNDGQYYRFTDAQSGDCQEIAGKVTIQGPKTYTSTTTCKATNELVTSGEVQVGTESQAADVTYTAGSRIQLTNGFSAQSGSRFRAVIE